jgi:uncharacterized protein YcnI
MAAASRQAGRATRGFPALRQHTALSGVLPRGNVGCTHQGAFMHSFTRSIFAIGAASFVTFSGVADAHVSLAGPGFAKQNQVLKFSIGHGCEGADTFKLEVAIPKEVTSVRGLPSAFGNAQVKKDDTGAVVAVAWSKPAADVLPGDDQFYEMSIRIGVPDMPFTTLYFPATQSCRAADGTETVVEWKALPEEVAAAKMGEEPEPAPALVILPARSSGWNKLTVPTKVTDLSIFKDALIVWAGDAAYSSNPATAEQIKSEDDVTELKEIAAGTEIWVKY